MASEFYTIEGKAQKKIQKLRNRQGSEFKGLRYKRLVAEIVKKTIESGNPKLTNNDIKAISLKIYKSDDLIKCSRVKSMMTQEIVKNDINNELQRIYTDAGLSKEALKPLLESIKTWIDEKKDITNALKLVERIERANNLEQKAGITARTTETTDFSRIGKDGQPAQKVVKTLEVTTNSDNMVNEDKNGSIRDATSDDNGQGSDNV